MDRKAKIIATIGPSCQDESVLRSLIKAGLDVARLNFSHGTHEEHAARIASIRKLSAEANRPITILQDLQGPKLRVGNLPPEGVKLTVGQSIRLSTHMDPNGVGKSGKSGEETLFIPMDVPDLEKNLEKGNRILLDDGQLELEVIQVGEDFIESKVVLGGILLSHKGVNLPGAHLDIPGFTEKDRADLVFGLQQGVDAVAISFVRTAEDIEVVRKAINELAPLGTHIPIVAKLEKPEAVENLHAIIHATDGVMVARGDLAVETSTATVPIVQKEIIRAANHHGKFVITATQMLDSMINNPRPTRAEASDVANAIFDGTDAVMLSGETASGHYPVESVATMHSIVLEAENHFAEWGQSEKDTDELTTDDAVSLTRAARELAHDRNVAAIAVFTQTGRTALLMSKARPRVPIMAFTPEISTYQKMGLYWGVTSFLVPYASSVETMVTHVDAALISATSIRTGEQVVMISGLPVGAMRQPNFALLHTLGETL
jgi:pyruvate kinase